MKLLITILSIFYTLPSFASVNGKGIVCECIECKQDHLDPSSYMPNKKPSEIGFHFKTNKVAIYYITKVGDNIKVSENIKTTLRKKKKFSSNENEIRWTYKDSLNLYAYSLDRKTLILSKMNILKNKVYNTRKCEPFAEIDFFERMNELSENYQSIYDDKSNKNKI
ncbi:hypothetical protein N9O66_06500 [Alphaproteobacteria bacterium]|nr:hypothetical protein [Alphaproteobacteria bacterium]